MINIRKQTLIKGGLAIFISFVFIQSLFFKFSGAPETQHIFGTLDAWAAGHGFPGLFLAPGIFNAYVIGSAELVASVLLLVGFFKNIRLLTGLGSLLGIGIMTGAISFHLFTPLGINVNGDGGTLFYMAIAVWVSCAVLLIQHKDIIIEQLAKIKKGA